LKNQNKLMLALYHSTGIVDFMQMTEYCGGKFHGIFNANEILSNSIT